MPSAAVTETPPPPAPPPAPLIPPAPQHRKVIRPRTGWQPVDLAELWRYRELLYLMVWRDVKVRYKETVLGAAWVLLQPAMTMVVFTIFFGRLGGMAQQVAIPYPVFAYAGLLAWTYFAAAVGNAGNSLLGSSNLISKVYFPRLIIPLATAGVGLVDFAVSCGLMFGLMAWYGVPPTPAILLLPLYVALMVTAAVGFGTLFAALVTAYRDFRSVLGFVVQLWMFASPVVYPIEVVPEQWQLVYALNPMAGVVLGFRSALLGTPMRWDIFAVSAVSAVVVLVVGLFYFKRVERRFADLV